MFATFLDDPVLCAYSRCKNGFIIVIGFTVILGVIGCKFGSEKIFRKQLRQNDVDNKTFRSIEKVRGIQI